MEVYIARKEPEVRPLARVYYPGDAPLYMGNNVPLYLEWIIEGGDSELYLVPAEAGGWLRRAGYSGQRSQLRPVSLQKAQTIIRFVCAELETPARTDDKQPAPYTYY